MRLRSLDLYRLRVIRRSPSPTEYRYGDFQELFWDAEPDAVIDPANRIMLACVITSGSMEAVRVLVSPEVLRRHLPTLPVTDHARRFWEQVLEGAVSASLSHRATRECDAASRSQGRPPAACAGDEDRGQGRDRIRTAGPPLVQMTEEEIRRSIQLTIDECVRLVREGVGW
jgi:hypothetical protein